MPYDPQLPIDEQPQRRWRWTPWIGSTVMLALVLLVVVL